MLYCPGSGQESLSALGVTLVCHASNVFLVLKVLLPIIDPFSKSMTLLAQAWLTILEPLHGRSFEVSQMFFFSGIHISASFSNITPRTICTGNFTDDIGLRFHRRSEFILHQHGRLFTRLKTFDIPTSCVPLICLFPVLCGQEDKEKRHKTRNFIQPFSNISTLWKCVKIFFFPSGAMISIYCTAERKKHAWLFFRQAKTIFASLNKPFDQQRFFES